MIKTSRKRNESASHCFERSTPFGNANFNLSRVIQEGKALLDEFQKNLGTMLGASLFQLTMGQILDNLNISHYVSTAKAEEKIDLKAVHKELGEMEKTIKSATKEHNKYLKGLGLPPLA